MNLKASGDIEISERKFSNIWNGNYVSSEENKYFPFYHHLRIFSFS